MRKPATEPAAPEPETAQVTKILERTFGWEAVESADYKQYIENLRSVGCPDETIRDIIIDRVPVFWVSDNRYVAVAIIAALVVFFAPHRRPGIRREVLLWADALGLALFATLGTEICLDYNTGPLVAVMLGVTTAVTGGMIRDVICNEIPLILSREIYATAAFAASLAYVLADRLALGDNVALIAGVLTGLAVRGLAIRYNWSLPSFGSSR